MADNAAQAIKDLQKNLSELDVSLDKTIKIKRSTHKALLKCFKRRRNKVWSASITSFLTSASRRRVCPMQ